MRRIQQFRRQSSLALISLITAFIGLASPIASVSADVAGSQYGLTKAQVGPSSASIGQTVHTSGQIYNTGADSGPIIIDFEVHDTSNNNKVYQHFYTNQNIPAGGRYTINDESWTPTTAGKYVFQYGVFANDWSKTYQYGNIGNFTVVKSNTNTAPNYSISKAQIMHATPATVGTAETLYGFVNNSGSDPGKVIVDFEVHDANNNKVYQKFYTDQDITTNGQMQYSQQWTPTVAGDYVAQYGVFANDWSKNYVYQTFDKVTVQNATPTPPSTTNGTYSGYGYQVSPTNVTTTISRATAKQCGTNYLCSVDGIKIGGGSATCNSFDFTYEKVSDNVQTSAASGGFDPKFGYTDYLMINPDLSNGTYTGSLQLQLCTDGQRTTYVDGPKINYTINLTD